MKFGQPLLRAAFSLCGSLAAAFTFVARGAAPPLLDAQFEMPAGFHIYRAAEPALTGGSYVLAFDADGRLLVADGSAIRRVSDADGDGVYDHFETIATGLGPRGPQGLLVFGDRLYAVGGDGLQLFEGYRSGRLVPRGRLGAKFNTGGDHDLHTVLRGPDGFLYLMAGNGAGVDGRKHITERSSPMLQERQASVFRLDPEGQHWECFAAGGRNPPGLGLNYLGELFSFDSDMEWHVGLPWYRAIRLNHWAAGTDQGWEDVGAHPDYFIDSVAPVLEAGRGSPTWGVFYQHHQLPAAYRNAFLNCDYQWKRESDNQYATPGRLVAFFLERDGAEWKARMETVARPKAGARDSQGRPINFALVAVEVAPDGSLLLSDHNQGLWRIFYSSSPSPIPPLQLARNAAPSDLPGVVREMLDLPQPFSEWTRAREELLWKIGGAGLTNALQQVALSSGNAVEDRVRAIQLLAPGYSEMDQAWMRGLAGDAEPEIRAQAAWLLGLRSQNQELPLLLKLLADPQPLVRRRAVESFTRTDAPEVLPELVARLNDSSRLTRSIAMNALARHPLASWFDLAARGPEPQKVLRALVAARIRGEALPDERVREIVHRLLQPGRSPVSAEDRADLLRVLTLFEKSLSANPESRALVEKYLLAAFPASVARIRWEQASVAGAYRLENAFGPLAQWLKVERDPVTQFRVAQALARLPGGWTEKEELMAMTWFEGTQHGWFADFADKGVEFPGFWATTLKEFAGHHPDLLRRRAAQIDVTSLLGGALIDLLVETDRGGGSLAELYSAQGRPEAKARVADAFGRVANPQTAGRVRAALQASPEPPVRLALLRSLCKQPVDPANVPFLIGGLNEGNDDLVRFLAAALVSHRPALGRDLAQICLSRAGANLGLVHSMERLLATLAGQQRPGYCPDLDLNSRADEPLRAEFLRFWGDWYQKQFGQPFVASAAGNDRSDDEVLRFILSDASRGGSAGRGAAVYQRLQCHTCHGRGPDNSGRIFGPDLSGVARRLSRSEFAEALAFPSRQVADRFKAFELEKADGTHLIGFVTEQTAEAVVIATPQSVETVPRKSMVRLAPQSASLMPSGLLNKLSDDDIRALMAYLEAL